MNSTITRTGEFMETILGDAPGWIELRLIQPGQQTEQRWYEHVDAIREDWPAIRSRNSEGWNIYFGACMRTEQKGNKDHVEHVGAAWADIDGCTVEDATERLKRLPVHLQAPTFIVGTGNGTHFYWCFKEPVEIESAEERTSLEKISKRLAYALDSDPAVAEVARVMRLPNTLNVKDRENHKPCEVIAASDTRFNPSDFDGLPPLPEPERPEPRENPLAGDRPGDEFNQRGDVRELLLKHGWKQEGADDTNEFWCRPGKESGVSATLRIADTVLYNFSSNAPGFEPNEAYSPFAVYANLECDGDMTAAAKSLAGQGYGKQPVVAADPATSVDGPSPDAPLWATLGALIDDPATHTPKPPIPTNCNALDDCCLFRRGCLSVLSARVKSGKSQLVSCMARWWAIAQHSVLMFPLEDTPAVFVWRLESATAKVPFDGFVSGSAWTADATKRIEQSREFLRELPLRISGSTHLDTIEHTTRMHAAEGGDIVIVDLLSWIVTGQEKDGIYASYSHAVDTLTRLAAETGLCILLVAQCNRAGSRTENPDPASWPPLSVYDLKGTGQLEAHAAAVLFIDAYTPIAVPGQPGDYWKLLTGHCGANRYGPAGPDRKFSVVWNPAWSWCDQAGVMPYEVTP